MKLFNSKLGLKLSIIYLGLFLLAAIIVGLFGVGLYIVIITLPWSSISVTFLDSLGYIAWCDKLYESGNRAAWGFFTMLGLLPSALLNATILYFLGKSLDKASSLKMSTGKANNLWKKFNLLFWIVFILVPASYLIRYYFSLLPPAHANFFLEGQTTIFYILIDIASISLISYFGYAFTLKRKYLWLGLLATFSIGFFEIGLVVSYIILWRVKKNLIN